MGLIKKDGPIPAAPESGTAAAIDRLTAPKTQDKGTVAKEYKPRDFDAEARGKTKCVMFAAALQSPALAGLKFKDITGFLALVEEAAERGVKYSFGDK